MSQAVNNIYGSTVKTPARPLRMSIRSASGGPASGDATFEFESGTNNVTRRQFLSRSGYGIGALALSNLILSEAARGNDNVPSVMGPHFLPRAKRMICLFQSGAPSQLDLFDHKPLLNTHHGSDLPESVRQGQRLTSMSAGQARWPLAGSHFKFRQHGESGAWLSELLPYTAAIADRLCFVKSLQTDAINHDPAITLLQTGTQLSGRPSVGAWLSYGLGSTVQNLPTFVVMTTRGQGGQPVYSRLWGSGFLPASHQGVRFRSGRDPVLFLNNPDGVTAESRRNQLDHLRRLHELNEGTFGDSAIKARIQQYEMAYRMQTSVPEVTELTDETETTFEMYGPQSRQPGSYAANCILARRLVERGVRCVQLFHRGWDQHGDLPKQIRGQCEETDQPSAALVRDLHARGLLDDTLVIWGGEFGRTSYSQGKLTANAYGRDHHPRCFSVWMAGGGIQPGITYGETDEFGYNVVRDPVHVHDLQATMLHLFGIDHERLTFKHQGRRFRLTDVYGNVVRSILG
ncbi:MAG: DUF1501 domain-containing protein [Fuerstiella sp.]|nr:DUF1501 domain-containing protein [Fuerstiella sp.]